MLLIVEIILVIVAWNRGWKAKALLPMAVAIGIGMVIGVVIAASGTPPQNCMPLLIVGDVVAVGWLGRMAAKGPTHVSAQQGTTQIHVPTAQANTVPTASFPAAQA